MASASNDINSKKNRHSGSGNIITYPNNSGDFKTLILIKPYKYEGAGKVVSSIGEGAIELPLPEALVDNLNVSISGSELGVLGSLGASLGSTIAGGADANTVSTSIGAVSDQLRSVAKSAGATTREIFEGNLDALVNAAGKGVNAASFLTRAGLASILPDASNGFGAGAGNAVNPFATLVFSGVNLKTFTLNWKLSPESPQQSDAIRNIINEIRRAMLPEYQNVLSSEGDVNISAIDRGLLTYPSMAEIMFTGIDLDYYFRFKTCMISDLSTDFSPNGVSILKNGKPAFINLSITFKEAHIHTREDYPEGFSSQTDATSVGGAASTTTGEREDGSNQESLAQTVTQVGEGASASNGVGSAPTFAGAPPPNRS